MRRMPCKARFVILKCNSFNRVQGIPERAQSYEQVLLEDRGLLPLQRIFLLPRKEKMSSPFHYPEGSHQLKDMEDDASFLVSTYVVSKICYLDF
jgi:hypothetical protein